MAKIFLPDGTELLNWDSLYPVPLDWKFVLNTISSICTCSMPYTANASSRLLFQVSRDQVVAGTEFFYREASKGNIRCYHPYRSMHNPSQKHANLPVPRSRALPLRLSASVPVFHPKAYHPTDTGTPPIACCGDRTRFADTCGGNRPRGASAGT